MSSQLDSILDAVEAMSVSGVTTVYRGSSLKDSAEIADIPMRIISAIGMSSARVQTKTLGGSGHVMMAEWTITDLALLRSAGMGLGLSDVAPNVEQYLAAYHNAVKTLTAPSWSVVDLRCRAQVLEFPAASGRNYDAVVATLVFREINQ
jgi:hypothetical protein